MDVILQIEQFLSMYAPPGKVKAKDNVNAKQADGDGALVQYSRIKTHRTKFAEIYFV